MNRRREALPVPRFSKLLSLLALLALCAASAEAQGLAVARVVDGDTFELSDGRTVRLVGIDTPEKHMSGKLRSDAEETGRRAEVIQALGRAASQEAKRLAGGKRVELEYDQHNASSGHEGSYGRTLAYVWVVSEGGERRYMVNRKLVAGGYAHAYLEYPSERGEAFQALERRAREARRGLWGEDGMEPTGEAVAREEEPVSREHLPFDPAGPDRNCSDFDSHRVAQAFFGAAEQVVEERDRHGLDRDGDGTACEGLQ
jgi:micrococcal nuclease